MILICDDDASVRSSLNLVLSKAGYETAMADSPAAALDAVRSFCPQLILMDMNYTNSTTGEEGLELLGKVRIFCPRTPVVLITAWGSIELAVKGMKAGAWDFVTKPWNNLTLLNVIRTAIEVSGIREENPEDGLSLAGFRRDKIIGRSPALLRVLETAARIAPTNAPVLITGESGTGKELIAEAIHENSTRTGNDFVKVNLGGISQSLFESEMFGHKKGAFTDAHYDRKGRFELADKGTIFLDEIGELDPVCQVKLLRVLQDQTFEPLGQSRQVQVDTRVISATNRNLQDMVADGTFREDLFYRINLITLRMPSLRERIEDIPLLARYFADLQTRRNGLSPVGIKPEGMALLKKLPWPGNIRELKNLIDRTILVTGKQEIGEEELRCQYEESAGGQIGGLRAVDEVEKNMILKAVKTYGTNISKIASALGISRQALYRRIEKYGIELPE